LGAPIAQLLRRGKGGSHSSVQPADADLLDRDQIGTAHGNSSFRYSAPQHKTGLGDSVMKLLDWLHQFQDGMGQGMGIFARPGAKPARLQDGTRHRLLGNVAKVIVETWDTGPFATDMCWLLADAEDRILFVLPTGTMPGRTLLDRLVDTPGFDRRALARALRSTKHARYTIWRRDLAAAR